MVNEISETGNETNINENKQDDSKFNGIKSLSPLAAISIITLIGLVCVVIDFYLEIDE